MNEIEQKGKSMTIKLFVSVLLVSIFVIVSYNILLPNVETKKIIQQIIRFCLTAALMYFILKGKKWAKDIFTLLLSLGIILGIRMIFSSTSINSIIPLLVMILIYIWTVYHLNFSNSFKAYFKKISN